MLKIIFWRISNKLIVFINLFTLLKNTPHFIYSFLCNPHFCHFFLTDQAILFLQYKIFHLTETKTVASAAPTNGSNTNKYLNIFNFNSTNTETRFKSF